MIIFAGLTAVCLLLIRVSEVVTVLFLMLMAIGLRAWPNMNLKRSVVVVLVCLICSMWLLLVRLDSFTEFSTVGRSPVSFRWFRWYLIHMACLLLHLPVMTVGILPTLA